MFTWLTDLCMKFILLKSVKIQTAVVVFYMYVKQFSLYFQIADWYEDEVNQSI